MISIVMLINSYLLIFIINFIISLILGWFQASSVIKLCVATAKESMQ